MERINVKTVQWNIHGGEIRPEDADPANKNAYTIKDLPYVMRMLDTERADIITLQETQSYGPHASQAKDIAKKLGMFIVEHSFSPSQFDPKAKLAVAILSKFPLPYPEAIPFNNPAWTVEKPNGDVWDTHDKGVLRVRAQLSHRKSIVVKTLHGFPPHEYGKSFEDPENQPIIKDMRDKLNENLQATPAVLIQGDFNIDAQLLTAASPLVRNVVPFFMTGIPIEEPTISTGQRVDHILFRGLEHRRTEIKQTRSDHAMLVSDFMVEV